MKSESIFSSKSAFMVHHILKNNKVQKKDSIKKKKNSKRKGNTHSKILKQKNSLLQNFNEISTEKNVELCNSNNQRKVQKDVSVEKVTKKNSNLNLHNSKQVNEKADDFKLVLFEDHFNNKTLFHWMIDPINPDDFMKSYWEQKPLYISKPHSDFRFLCSTSVINEILNSCNIQYNKNIDVTFYSDGLKELHNLEGYARPHVIWDFYCNKCSIRLLNPQTFVPNIHKLTSELQEYFGCFVGCNAYLTPPSSQGFAPHYDDIEAFILQIEGQKLWKVYKPRNTNECLPRYSSNDFTDKDVGSPFMEILLKEGDVLYLPRGFIHQATTMNKYHSLHITISAYQCNAWIDLLQKVIPQALDKAWKNDVEFRKGLPLDYLKIAGLSRNNYSNESRNLLKKKVRNFIHKLNDYVNVDEAVDQMGTKFLYDALPPVLTEEEKKCSVYGGGLKMTDNGQIIGLDEFEFSENVEVVLLRSYICRFVKEYIENDLTKKKKVEYRLYYTTDNSLEYHGNEASFLIVDKRFIKCIQYLFQKFPEFVVIKELPHENLNEKIHLIADLWDRGIVRTKTPILKFL